MNIIVRAKVKPVCFAEVVAGATKNFNATEQAQPTGVRYAASARGGRN
jgi:hypothetical protein